VASRILSIASSRSRARRVAAASCTRTPHDRRSRAEPVEELRRRARVRRAQVVRCRRRAGGGDQLRAVPAAAI